VKLGDPTTPTRIQPCPSGQLCTLLLLDPAETGNKGFSVKADVALSGPSPTALKASAVLSDLPSEIDVLQNGDAITIDTSRDQHAARAALAGRLAVATTTSGSAGLAQNWDGLMPGVKVRDAKTSDPAPATEVELYLPELPQVATANLKKLTVTTPPASTDRAFVLKGFTGVFQPTAPATRYLEVVIDLRYCTSGVSPGDCEAKRVAADLKMANMPASGMDIELLPIMLESHPRISGAGLTTQVVSATNVQVGYRASVVVGPLTASLHLGTDDVGADSMNKPLNETVVTAAVAQLPQAWDLAIKLDAETAFEGHFGTAAGLNDASPGDITVVVAQINDKNAGGTGRPNPLVDIGLRHVPGHFKLSLTPQPAGTPDSTGFGNCAYDPALGYYHAQQRVPLPKVTYAADGTNQDALDITSAADPAKGAFFRLSQLDPRTQDEVNHGLAPSPDLAVKIGALGHSFTFQNDLYDPSAHITKDFKVMSTPPTGDIQVYVAGFSTDIVDLNLVNCGSPKLDLGLVSFTLDGKLKLTLTSDLALEISGAGTDPTKTSALTLIPGFSTGVDMSNVGRVRLDLPGSAIRIRTATWHITIGTPFGDIKVPIFPTVDTTIPLGPALLFHVARTPDVLDIAAIPLFIPCGLRLSLTHPVKFLSLGFGVQPALKSISGGGFSVSGPDAKWVATADPFGAAGIATVLLGGIDVLDVIAVPFFTSPLSPKGLAPDVKCD
jgi:hypothetical protein